MFGGQNHTDLPILNRYATLCIEIAAARCWSQCQYSMCVPNVFAGVHHSDHNERERSIKIVKKIWDAVLKAERLLEDSGIDASVRSSLKQVLDHMAWHKGQVARELYLVCENANWDHRDSEVRELGFYLFSNPANTKHFLEDTFTHLADVSKRAVRNLKLTKRLASPTGS